MHILILTAYAVGATYAFACVLVTIIAVLLLGPAAGLRFGGVNAIQLAATVAGWVVLLPFCLAQSFQLTMSPFVKTPAQRIVDKWKWEPLNAIYGNPEDGVSGRFAVIWGSGADEGKQVQYMPDAPAWKRAYCWSALRNTADGLKYKFAWDGPLATGTVLGRHYQIGWKARSTTQGTGPALPVISI